jgi:hypothetical protein
MARRKSTAGPEDDTADEKKAESKKEDKAAEPKAADPKSATTAEPKTDPKTAVPVERAEAETQPIAAAPGELPAIDPPEPKAEPWPDATPAPMKPVEPPEVRASRTPTATIGMQSLADLGKPPEMPQSSAPPPLALGDVESPTHMPGPKDVPAGSPEDPAPPPGVVPPGDSRSLRRGGDFALIYRVGTCVITRTGVVGTRGQWRVVEYPTSAFAANSYAKECSRFVSEGFSDYRE